VRNGEKFNDFMHSISSRYGLEGWVVFPTEDESVFFLSQYRKDLSDQFRITTPCWDIIRHAYDKRFTYRTAEKIGLPIPGTWYPDSKEELQSLDLPYPVIIKPAVMRDFFRVTHKKVYRAVDADDLVIQYEKACRIIDPTNIIIQEEIPEVWNHLYSFCPFFKEGEVKARVIAKRIRQHPMDYGHASTYVKTVDCPELEELGSRFLKAIDYYGLCEVEFIWDQRERIFRFLEVNPRVWGWHTLARHAGVNLPYLVYRDMVGLPPSNGQYRSDVKWIRLLTDTPTVISEMIKGRMDLKHYFDSLKGEKSFAVFSWSDPLPFFMEIFRLPILWKKRGF
jgi:predicted ATP-grasp superfamily ATP-dependent carboligase